MSERAQGHRVPTSSAQHGSPPTARDSWNSGRSAHELPQAAPVDLSTGPGRPETGPLRGLELPPLSRATPAGSGSSPPSATRIAGVASILNPPESEGQTGHRRKISQLDSPTAPAQRLPSLAASVRNNQGDIGHQSLSPQPIRRILTPRSPSGLHRAASLGQINQQAGVINAQQVPFPPSPRKHTAEPGKFGVPPLPTPSAQAQSTGYGFPASVPPSGTARRASTGTSRARKLSLSASPTTSYSSYSQAGQTSPIGPYASSTGPSLPGVSHHEQRRISDSAASDAQRQTAIPISSSGGQNVYQMMTLETTSGTVQLPVDVQAASRVADEKRRRNAGASARFRQRRKEKEREASTSIARLEQQVKDLSEEVDFYRNDRAGLLAVMRTIPGTERHHQRPPSPQQLRGRGGLAALPTGSRRTSNYIRPSDSQPQSPETERNVRRRTSTFSLPPPSQLPGPSLQPNYTPSGYTTPIAPQPPPGPLGPLPALQRQQPPPPPPSVMQTHPPTGPYNPFSSRDSESAHKEENR